MVYPFYFKDILISAAVCVPFLVQAFEADAHLYIK